MKATMEEEKKNRKESKVDELSDAEFVSFLYAERDRENILSRYQGWNIGVLAVAIAEGMNGRGIDACPSLHFQ